MDGTSKTKSNELKSLVEEHFVEELQLAAEIEELNQATASVFEGAGLRGPSITDLEALHPLTQKIEDGSKALDRKRKILMGKINASDNCEYESLRDFIQSLEPGSRQELEGIRHRVLERTTKAQAHMVHNQAALFYTFDFHRKFLAGILNTDPEQQSYRADGHSHDLGPGNLVRKTC
ncbi:MAG: hypothetical protein ACE361_12855 [Aureliella sp.]